MSTSRLSKTGHHQQKPCNKGKNDPLHVTLGYKVMKLWAMKVCQNPG